MNQSISPEEQIIFNARQLAVIFRKNLEDKDISVSDKIDNARGITTNLKTVVNIVDRYPAVKAGVTEALEECIRSIFAASTDFKKDIAPVHLELGATLEELRGKNYSEAPALRA